MRKLIFVICIIVMGLVCRNNNLNTNDVYYEGPIIVEEENKNTVDLEIVEKEITKEDLSDEKVITKQSTVATENHNKHSEGKEIVEEIKTSKVEIKEEPKEQPKESEETKIVEQKKNEETKTKTSTSFYDSITGGKKEFSSKSACNARGMQIMNAELDYVLDYNSEHPDNPIEPDINYFRCYPVVDDEGEGWYLHFFCKSGEGNDQKLKSMY